MGLAMSGLTADGRSLIKYVQMIYLYISNIFIILYDMNFII